LVAFHQQVNYIFSLLLNHTSEGMPGSVHRYNNDRYVLLGNVMLEASGKTFAQLRVDRQPGDPSGFVRHFRPAMGLVTSVRDLAAMRPAMRRLEP
jgi:hypothetical protein